MGEVQVLEIDTEKRRISLGFNRRALRAREGAKRPPPCDIRYEAGHGEAGEVLIKNWRFLR
jgi:ribosomal protein S1